MLVEAARLLTGSVIGLDSARPAVKVLIRRGHKSACRCRESGSASRGSVWP